MSVNLTWHLYKLMDMKVIDAKSNPAFRGTHDDGMVAGVHFKS
jgi:hypothetical protein